MHHVQFILLFKMQISRLLHKHMFQGLAWVPTKFTNRSTDHPDIEFHFVSGSPASDGGRQIRKVR